MARYARPTSMSVTHRLMEALQGWHRWVTGAMRRARIAGVAATACGLDEFAGVSGDATSALGEKVLDGVQRQWRAPCLQDLGA
jgi:hypothetical protein